MPIVSFWLILHPAEQTEFTLTTHPFLLSANKNGITILDEKPEASCGDEHKYILDCRVQSSISDSVELDTIMRGIKIENQGSNAKCVVDLCGDDDNCQSLVSGDETVELSFQVLYLLLISW